MANPLYLTKDELKLFKALSTELQDGWKVEEEKLTAYETENELQMRAMMFKKEQPKYAPLLEKLAAAQPQNIGEELASLPQEVLYTIFFTLGAKSLGLLMLSMLQGSAKDEDIESIAQLSYIRHVLLEGNTLS